MAKIKAVIFDMDGVLIDAKDWHYEALNKALDYFGMGINRYDHITNYDGFPTRKKLEYLSVEKNLPRGLHDFIHDLKQKYTVDQIMINCKPQYNHQFALARFKQKGYKLAVCSNSVRQTVELMLKRAEILQYFDFFLSNEDVQESKPDPEMYITAIKRLDVMPEECLIVEDNPQGIKSARASRGYVLEVCDTRDVNYENIIQRIDEIESGAGV